MVMLFNFYPISITTWALPIIPSIYFEEIRSYSCTNYNCEYANSYSYRYPNVDVHLKYLYAPFKINLRASYEKDQIKKQHIITKYDCPYLEVFDYAWKDNKQEILIKINNILVN